MILISGGIDHAEAEIEQLGIAFAPVTRDAGSVVDQRETLAHQPVEQSGLADIGTADDGDGGQQDRDPISEGEAQ